MSKKDFYEKLGIKDNPFPMSGVTPAENIGKLDYLEPIGIEEEKVTILEDFDRHIRNQQSGGYSFIGDYGQGKSLVLHHLHELFIKKRKGIQDIQEKIIIGYVRGKALAPKFKNEEIPADILSIVIKALEFNSNTLKDNIKDEFLHILDLDFTPKSLKFNEIVNKHNIARIFIFVDEVEDIRKYSGAIETYRDLIDEIPKITIFLFSTREAWVRITEENPAIVQEDLGLGRIKEFYLPPFTFDIAIKAVNLMIKKAKFKGSDFVSPFTDGLIRSICLCSQFNGRVFNIICNLLFHNYLEDLNIHNKREKKILPNEFLNEKIFNRVKVEKKKSHLFNFEIYYAILNSIDYHVHKELFKFFLAYYDNFSFNDIREYVRFLGENDDHFKDISDTRIMEFLFKRTDVLRADLRIVNEIARIDLGPIDTEQKFIEALTGKWANHLLYKKSKSHINVPTFDLLSLDNMKYVFGMGNEKFSIPFEKYDDITIMINSSKISATFESRKSEFLVKFLIGKNCLEKQDEYRISEYLIFKIFNRHTPLGFNPWDLILDINNQELVKSYFNKRKGTKDLFEITSEGALLTFKQIRDIYPNNFQFEIVDERNFVEIKNFWYAVFHHSTQLISRSKFFSAYIANNKEVIEDLYNKFIIDYKIPNGFILLIDDEPEVIEDFYNFLDKKLLKDQTPFEDRIMFLPINEDNAILLFLIGLNNLEGYQNRHFRKNIEFDTKSLKEIIVTLANNFVIKFRELLNGWLSKQKKNGLYLRAINNIDEDRFIGGVLPSLEKLNTLSVEKSKIDIDIMSDKDFFMVNLNPLYQKSNFYNNSTYINGIPMIIGNLAQAVRMDLVNQDKNTFRIKNAPFEVYLLNLFTTLGLGINLRFNDLLDIFNFEHFSKEHIMKYYLASLGYKGIIKIFDQEMQEILIRKSEFLTKKFYIITLKDPIPYLVQKKVEIMKSIEKIESTKKIQCEHGVKVGSFINPSNPDLNSLNVRLNILLDKNKNNYKIVFGMDPKNIEDCESIDETIIRNNIGFRSEKYFDFLFKFPVIYWNNNYIIDVITAIKLEIDEAFNLCKEIHDNIKGLEKEIIVSKINFKNYQNKIDDFIKQIREKKIKGVESKEDE